MYVSKSSYEAQATGSNSVCHQAARRVHSAGPRAPRRSILATSHPTGKKPSIMEPESVVSRSINSLPLLNVWPLGPVRWRYGHALRGLQGVPHKPLGLSFRGLRVCHTGPLGLSFLSVFLGVFRISTVVYDRQTEIR